MTKIYVGNLPFSATDSEVRELFQQHGTVESVSLITDRDTGRPRGFGFVEMSRADASRAIQNLNGKDLGGRPLRVNEAQERTGGGGGGNRSGGGGGPKRWEVSSSDDQAGGPCRGQGPPAFVMGRPIPRRSGRIAAPVSASPRYSLGRNPRGYSRC